MPLQTKVIKQKIKSVQNIKKITKTMEMVSVSKMRKSVEKNLTSRDFAKNALRILVSLSLNNEITHPLMSNGLSRKKLIILITSNKGLCGGYNTNIFKVFNRYVNKNKKDGFDIYSINIGKYAEKMSKKLKVNTFASFNMSENSSLNEIRELSDLICKEYRNGEYENGKILYTEFINSTNYKPVMKKLFPISMDSLRNILEENSNEEKSNSFYENYLFEPSISGILDNILPGLIGSVVHQTLTESFASEHSARMFAMKNAGDNASSILDNLMLSYNHARQDGITKELSEIVAGADALNFN